MIISDVGAGISTLLVAGLLLTGQLKMWHIYALAGVSAAFGTLQWPAFTATTSLLVSKESLGRANGLLQFGQAASEILAPALAGVLVGAIKLEGVILIDAATFVFAVVMLLAVRLPRPRVEEEKALDREPFWRGLSFGWRYISARAGLVGLLIFAAVVNFLWGMVAALLTPMVLGWAPSDILGAIISIAGVGMLTGSLVMSTWGGPRRRINAVLAFELLSGLCFMLMGLRPSFWLVAAGAFGAHVTIAIVQSSNQAIWQSKVEPQVQGRVFATQQMVARSTAPVAFVLAGLLADRVFNPLLHRGGPLATTLGPLLGIGPSRGIGLMFILMGAIKVLASVAGRLSPRIRNVEAEVPEAVVGA
jgi:MFS family permease